jgi:hypothetical protein
VTAAVGGMVTVEFALDGSVTQHWVTAFAQVPTGHRSGSYGYLVGPDPEVTAAGKIQWTIPEGDLEDAVKCVTTLVENVNRKTEEVMARARTAMQKHQAEHQAHQERIDELQRRLDDM